MLDVAPIRVAGIRTAVHVAGPHDADETVLFVHGNPGPLDDWEDIAPRVATLARVVAPDLPGFGRADRTPGFDYGVAGYGAFLGALLDQLEVRGRVHLVAHDFGGAWATAWAGAHRDRVASVTLISTPVVPSFAWHAFARIWSTPIVGPSFQALASRRAIAWVMQRDNPRPLPKAFVDRVTSYADLSQKLRVTDIYRRTRDAAATFGPVAEILRAIDPPACVVWGSADPYADPKNVDATCRLFTDVERHVIDGTGHWPFVDAPERVGGIVFEFLKRQISA